MSPPYTFQTVTQSDLPQLEVWLQGPEIVTWWGDPVEQAELLRSDIAEPRSDEGSAVLMLFKV